MRCILLLGLFLFLGLSASAQTITVRNFLNPDAPVARDSFAIIEFTSTGGEAFSNEDANDPVNAPTSLGGVTVRIEGVLQRIRSVSSSGVVFLVSGAGKADRALEVQTKFNVIHRTSIKVVSVWPSLPVQGTGDDSESFYPAGFWTLDPSGIQTSAVTSAPITVGSATNPTVVFIQVSGVKQGMSTKGISVRLNGIQCRVVGLQASFFPGQDVLAFQIPPYLAGNGVMDLIVTVAGRSSNAARLNLGVAAGLAVK